MAGLVPAIHVRGAARRIERAVDAAYGTGIKPYEFGGRDGTMAVGVR